MLLDRPEVRLAVALCIGLVIGAERERRKEDPHKRVPAGIRTFAIVALVGGVAALLESTALLVSLAVIVGAIAVAAYVTGDRADPGVTTEAALVLTYCLGALALRNPKVAIATGISAATVLAFRTHLHTAARAVLSESELHDALLFAVAAVVILPLVPNRAVDPLGVVNPFTLWRLVVVLMGLSGAGYVMQRLVGPRYGLALAGFGSGFVSSSMTVAAMGTLARNDPQILAPAVAGAAASTVATFVQLAVLVGAASPRLLSALALPLGAGAATALAYALVTTWRARRAEASHARGRAFKISTAVLFALLVTAIAFVSTLAQRWLGAAAAMVTSAIAGFADAHAAAAAIASVAASDRISLQTAEVGVLLPLTTNTVTKAVLAISSGPREFSVRVIVGLALALAATWAALLALFLTG